MKTIKIFLTLFIGVAIGATAHHVFSQFQSTTKPTDGLKISHSTSHPQRTAIEADFANQYARFHDVKDLEGLLAMGKFERVPENGVSSIRGWMERSFTQRVVDISFHELNDWEIRKLADLSLEPLLKCTISYAQNGPDDVMRSSIYNLSVEGGHLYIVDRVKK